MGLLEKLKSAIGLDASRSEAKSGAAETGRQNVDVTVEHEPESRPDPDTGTEDAVKGTGEMNGGGTVTEVETASESESDGAAAEAEATDHESDAPVITDAAEPVDSIKGIGPAYAERLSGIGVETVDDLVETGAESIAAETDLSEKRVTRWKDRAGESTED